MVFATNLLSNGNDYFMCCSESHLSYAQHMCCKRIFLFGYMWVVWDWAFKIFW